MTEIVLPKLELDLEPYPYQIQGVKWLYDRAGAILADAPGAGKTAQALLAARILSERGLVKSILIVCPKTLFATWQSECAKWWPSVTAHAINGAKHSFLLDQRKAIKLVNYEVLARENRAWLKLLWHDLIIADEIQKGKNPSTAIAKALKSLRAGRRWGLTGTPLENKLDDLLSILDFVQPEPFPHTATVIRTSREPPYWIEMRESVTQTIAETIARSLPQEIPQHLSEHLLRRRIADVLPDLPEIAESDVELVLGDSQRERYDQVERDGVLALNELGDEITVMHVFQLIARLRQVCNFDPVTGQSSKMERLLADLEEIAASGSKTLVFSQWVNDWGLARIALALSDYKPLLLHGGVPFDVRSDVIEQFTTDPARNVLLLNFRVGGLGLNIQAANYVYLFDRWWNPAVEEQAVKCAHRLGQQNKVFVRRFVCRGTIEERVLQKLASKRRLFRDTIDATEPSLGGLTEEEIFSLFNISVLPKRKDKDPESQVVRKIPGWHSECGDTRVASVNRIVTVRRWYPKLVR